MRKSKLALLGGLFAMALFFAAPVSGADGSLLPTVNPADMLGVAGASVVVFIIVGVILNAWRPTADTRDRFGPLLCLVVAELVTVGFAVLQGADLSNAVIVGILVTGGADFTHSISQAVSTK